MGIKRGKQRKKRKRRQSISKNQAVLRKKKEKRKVAGLWSLTELLRLSSSGRRIVPLHGAKKEYAFCGGKEGEDDGIG